VFDSKYLNGGNKPPQNIRPPLVRIDLMSNPVIGNVWFNSWDVEDGVMLSGGAIFRSNIVWMPVLQDYLVSLAPGIKFRPICLFTVAI
jgi:hypothetical protein